MNRETERKWQKESIKKIRKTYINNPLSHWSSICFPKQQQIFYLFSFSSSTFILFDYYTQSHTHVFFPVNFRFILESLTFTPSTIISCITSRKKRTKCGIVAGIFTEFGRRWFIEFLMKRWIFRNLLAICVHTLWSPWLSRRFCVSIFHLIFFHLFSNAATSKCSFQSIPILFTSTNRW